MKNQRKDISKTAGSDERLYDDATATFAQASFGWGLEDIGMQIQDMAGSAKETTYSMGDDAPIAALSERPHPLYSYFKQRFAQVTNPAIDSKAAEINATKAALEQTTVCTALCMQHTQCHFVLLARIAVVHSMQGSRVP